MTNEHQHEERVRAAVTEALERIEAPDRGRLARLETRLLAGGRRRRRAHPWWWTLLGMGLAVGAAAAWWGWHATGEVPEDPDRPAMAPDDEAGNTAWEGIDAGDGEKADRRDEGREDESPIIYIGQ